MSNIAKLIKLIGNNCTVIDIAVSDEEKDKIFSVVRKFKNYSFDVDFDILIKNGFIPKYMHLYDGKDEIIFEVK